MFLSIIIPTFNRATLLKKTLDSIQKQDLSSDLYEVIIVDNNSTDETKTVYDTHAHYFKNCLYVLEKNPGLHAARHAGLSRARGDVLIYIDDDIVTMPGWLEGIAENFWQPETVLLGGKILPDYEIPPPEWVSALWKTTPWGKVLYQYSLLDFGNSRKQIPSRYIFGCNFSIRKSVLQELRGFHPDSLPDNLIKYRGDGETSVAASVTAMGHKSIYEPRVSIKHYVPRGRLTKDYLYARSYAQGISDSYTTIRKHNGMPVSHKLVTFLRKQISRKQYLLNNNYGINKSIYNGYWSGVDFHAAQIRDNPKLLMWITRDNYLDSQSDRTYYE